MYDAYFDIANITLNIRRKEHGEIYTMDVVQRCITAAVGEPDMSIMLDRMSEEMLRCRIPNHDWSGAIG
jgi:hypothetical protein